jgi:hypothetical protein
MFRALLTHPHESYTSGTWYIACVLYKLAAPGLKWNQFHFNPGAAPQISASVWFQIYFQNFSILGFTMEQ